MRFELKHTFDCDPETLWAITDDEAFEERVAEISDSTRVTVQANDDNGVRYRLRRITLQRDLPAAIKKVLGGDRIQYDQETWRPLNENKLRWKITPMVLGDRFTGEGTTRVVATASGCQRIITGDLTVRVPLIGSTMEKRLVDDVCASYERAADIIREMLAQ